MVKIRVSELMKDTEHLEDIFGSLDLDKLADGAEKRYNTLTAKWVRKFLLVHGLSLESKPNPEYLILTGCILPLRSTLVVQSYFKLLDKLGIAYALLPDSEYCAGLANQYLARPGEQMEKANAQSRALIERNHAQARALGVKGVVYLCNSGFTIAQKVCTNSDLRILHGPDIILERLKGRTLRTKPTVVGYYKGCWRSRYAMNPKLKIDLEGYRSLLDRIKGLKVVDMRHNLCCHSDLPRIFAEAEKHQVDCTVTPCEGCHKRLKTSKTIPAKMIHDIVLDALEYEDGHRDGGKRQPARTARGSAAS